MSRGAFLAFLIYFISEVFLIRKLVLKNKLKFLFNLILATLIFALSTIIITTDIDFEFLNFGKKIEIVEDQNVLASGRAEVVARQLPIVFVEREFFGTTLSIFYQDGRFYSTEVTANWRLQLWQDVIEDVVSKDRLFIGYGYSEIIPAMTDPLNNGNDSTNENLHNYFVQVFARGGLLQLIIVILIIFTYISIWVKQKNNYKILQFVIPIIVVSVFDPTLETVRFPLIYYSFLGYFLSDKKVYS
jgi:O-antigen ligase